MTFPRAFKSYIPRTHCINEHVYGAIVVTPNNEVAVIKGRQSGKWSFPKGHGYANESPLDACLRELREETGLEMSNYKADEQVRFPTGTYFIFHINEKSTLIPEDLKEVEEVQWIPIDQLCTLRGNMDLRLFARRFIAM